MNNQLIEKYNLNHYHKQPSGDDFVDWLYKNTDADVPESDFETAWNKVRNQVQKSQNNNKPFQGFVKVAATFSLLIVLGYLGFMWDFQPEIVTITSSNKVRTIRLPDGSKVTINKGSKISFLDEFEEIRQVNLEGEAYFNVQKDDMPFQVRLSESYVRVLGTAFNVKEDDLVEVFVEHGVVILGKDDNKIEITKGQLGILSNQVLDLEKSPSVNVMSWRNGKFDFVDTEFHQAAKELEAYYEVKFNLAENVKNCRLTASFNKAPLSELLKVLRTILKVDIKQKQSTLEVTGKGC